MASRKSDGSDAWSGAADRSNGAYGAPAYAAPGQYAAPAPAVEQPWLVLLGGTEQRQVQASELRGAVQSGALALETLVWRAGMSSWAPISSIAELVQQPDLSAASWQTSPTREPTSARRAAEQYLSAHGPGLGDTTTYAAWDPPEGRIPLRREPPPATNITSELVATGMVVFGIVMFTLYVISLGGAFEAGSHPHEATSAGAHAAK